MDSPLFKGINTSLPRTSKRKISTKDETYTCSGCEGLVDSDLLLLEAMGEMWHFDCFRCTTCQKTLSEDYYEEKGRPYCREHFYEQFAHKCHQCQDYITGPTMAIGFFCTYHPECFYCFECGSPLGENDTFSLVTTGEIFCNTCAMEDSLSGQTKTRQKVSTVIQMISVKLRKKIQFKVEGSVPKANMGVKSFTIPQLPLPGEYYAKPNTLKIHKVPQSLLETPVRIGDEILEVNGIPIVNQDQREINQLMKANEDTLYLTIQRRLKELPPLRSSLLHKSHDIPSHGKTDYTITDISVPPPVSTVKKERMDQCISPMKNGSDDCSKEEERSLEHSATGTKITYSDFEGKSMRTRSLPASDAKLKYLNCFRLSDLEIGDVIGRGFYGNVTKVTHRHTGQVMVMKEMLNCTEESKKKFRKEVHLLKTLNHPNILHFIGILYKEGKVLNLITEYIGGGTLRKRIKRLDTHFPWELRIQISRDISTGMSYLHGQGIIHRDLTSKNCLLREDMTAVVADFGLARVFQPLEQTDGKMTSTERRKRTRMTVVGSPYWMAPEMLRGEAYDETVDIFSFGIVLCEIISRVKADPDQLPRLNNFGLDEPGFRPLTSGCPPPFYDLAVRCSSLAPDSRPTFHRIQSGLQLLLQLIDRQTDIYTLPEDFYYLCSHD